MANFLNKMRNKLNEVAAKASGSGPTGHVLGAEDDAGNHVFTVAFAKQRLGMTVSEGPGGRPVVTALDESGEANRMRVQRGDVVLEVEGGAVTDYAAFMAVVPSLGRPLNVTFRRGGRGSDPAPGRSESRAAATPPADAAAAREQRLAAAEARQKKYDSFTQGRRGGRSKASAAAPKTATTFRDSTDPTVLAAMERARKAEEAEIQRQGYNPYEAKSTSSAQATAIRSAAEVGESGGPAGTGGPAPPRPSAGAGGLSANALGAALAAVQVPAAEPPEDWEASLDAACAALADNEDQEKVGATKVLLLKILRNVHDKAHGDLESKFRRLRMGNAAVAEKVTGVDGGLALMVAAGFEYEEGDDGIGVLRFPHVGTSNYQPLQAAMERLEAMTS